ncbi:winged helix-turn-helix domain-containing protein [Nocardia sp. XZ_19_369]|uniref:winged helix-turn-helix domain-containing protein n=1 Tax=Nocardia sp. XZ_19_369 TaxID=2769487 RepID=UPI00188DE8E6|nr:winged helix-turn-helix domain-containing protein [Nocardia sp. XZ_19_369]
MTDNRRRAARTPREIADDLAAEITSGRLGPGALLPTVRELTTIHGVANRTILNALELLDAEHLITRRHGTRARVADPTTELRTLRADLDTLAAKLDTLRTHLDNTLARLDPPAPNSPTSKAEQP